MRTFIFILILMTLSIFCFSQKTGKQKVLTFKGVYVGTGQIADCGISVAKTSLFFISSEELSMQKDTVIVKIQCPNERFGKNFFVTNKTYSFKVRKIELKFGQNKEYELVN